MWICLSCQVIFARDRNRKRVIYLLALYPADGQTGEDPGAELICLLLKLRTTSVFDYFFCPVYAPGVEKRVHQTPRPDTVTQSQCPNLIPCRRIWHGVNWRTLKAMPHWDWVGQRVVEKGIRHRNVFISIFSFLPRGHRKPLQRIQRYYPCPARAISSSVAYSVGQQGPGDWAASSSMSSSNTPHRRVKWNDLNNQKYSIGKFHPILWNDSSEESIEDANGIEILPIATTRHPSYSPTPPFWNCHSAGCVWCWRGATTSNSSWWMERKKGRCVYYDVRCM